MKPALYSQMVKYYDRIYWWKDYAEEVGFLLKVFKRYGVQGKRILEVACGTGNHTRLLAARGYQVTGVDISDEMLRIARRKVRRRGTLLRGDMRNLDDVVRGPFDAAVCLFSSISYNLTMADLKNTLKGLHDHLKIGGVAVFDTHFTKESFIDGHRGEDIFDDGRVFGARLSTSTRKGDLGEITFSYLVKDGANTIVLRNDTHRLGLFSRAEYLGAMRRAGFEPEVFVDWTFQRPKVDVRFRDLVFVGRRLASS